MTPRARAPDFAKSGSLENAREPHEAIARRVRINRIGLDDRRAIAAGIVDGGLKQPIGEPLAAESAFDEETDNGPRRRLVAETIRSAERPIAGPRRNRALAGC